MSPLAAKKLVKKGMAVNLEQSAGLSAGFTDEQFVTNGVKIVSRDEAFASDVIYKINPPSLDEISLFKSKSILLSLLEPYHSKEIIEKLNAKNVTAFGLELVPRTSRAQSMDVLSSQANIAGYRAVLEASLHYKKFFPIMMTSAGLAKQAKLLVLGVGVAGLQAIATARRLGANVEAFDVRSEVKEQIQSLGAKFLDLGLGEVGKSEKGYATELTKEEKQKQSEALTERIKKFDIVVTTANVPGRKAPILISEDAVKGMLEGSVIVDMAAPSGGNCALTETDKVVKKFGVTIVGHTNYAGMVASDASLFFSQNLSSFLELLIKDVSLLVNFDDDIVAASCVCHDGKIRI